jgi:hypothetical protein
MKGLLKVLAAVLAGFFIGYVLAVIGITLISLILFFGAIHAFAVSFDAGLAWMKLWFVLAVIGWICWTAIKSIIFFWK